MARSYWLVKSEPTAFSIQDLERAKGKTTCWSGIRNYQARNHLRAMKKGDRLLFYHSNADPTGVVGVAEVVREAYPDPTALDPDDPHFEPRATEADPVWSAVDVKHVRTFARPITLAELKATPGLEGMVVVQKGSRLSVTPVTAAEFEVVASFTRRP